MVIHYTAINIIKIKKINDNPYNLWQPIIKLNDHPQTSHENQWQTMRIHNQLMNIRAPIEIWNFVKPNSHFWTWIAKHINANRYTLMNITFKVPESPNSKQTQFQFSNNQHITHLQFRTTEWKHPNLPIPNFQNIHNSSFPNLSQTYTITDIRHSSISEVPASTIHISTNPTVRTFEIPQSQTTQLNNYKLQACNNALFPNSNKP